eukprot:TRINITY_DN91077_c0_g1_i1.p1 TRINITY_DN91077_c0_g1~~TRINITY_DN91077_c0_g1_i1.p1  ORF type:complete len:744 (-),score=231.50 TRINITY_DN91077_c0_g1_i1:16-2247(-)
MGKQAALRQTALANALRKDGDAAVKVPVKETEVPKAAQPRAKKAAEPEPVVKTKADIEEEQRQAAEERARERAEFYRKEAEKKVVNKVSADAGVTYVEDKDTRKPKAVGDISEFWCKDMGFLPFLPTDNVAAAAGIHDAAREGIDPYERVEYLQMMNEKLEELLRLRFHIFWSQVIYDARLRRCIDSYLRFALRAHDLPADEVMAASGDVRDTMVTEERRLTREISKRMLAIIVRLSRPQESETDFISSQWYGSCIQANNIFDVPKLIDICAIYGDSNREVVTKIVHSVLSHQPDFKDDFKQVVEHILGGLHQCCEPLQGASSDLSVEECLTFLPDILSCFNAIFCFFPEDCVSLLLTGDTDGKKKAGNSHSVALADLMVVLHESVCMLEADGSAMAPTTPAGQFATIRALLCRLISLVLGFQMGPRKGADAFRELIEWLTMQVHHGELLADLGRYGLGNVAMDWLASGLVEDAQLDRLEELCGPVLGSEGRRMAKNRRQVRNSAGATASSSSSAQAPGSASASASDAAKIREIKEVVGPAYGDGFLLQCLLHYGGSVPAVVGGVLDSSLPPQLEALPIGFKIGEDPMSVGGGGGVEEPMLKRALSTDEKKRIFDFQERLERKEEMEETEDVYNDDGSDGSAEFGGGRVGGGAASGSEAPSEAEENQSSGEEGGGDRWSGWQNRGKGGKAKGGKGKGKGKEPVQGQTIQARRKEENKAAVANHNRRKFADAKMRKGMMGGMAG